MGKSGPNATFNLHFSWFGLALGWGVRRFHSSIFTCFQPQQNLVNLKHPVFPMYNVPSLPFLVPTFNIHCPIFYVRYCPIPSPGVQVQTFCLLGL